MKARVFGWAADTGACGYYRIENPFEEMARLGHKVSHGLSVSGQELVDDYDVVVAQRVVFPEVVEVLAAVQRSEGGSRVVYEIDDNLIEVDPLNPVAPHFRRLDVRTALLTCISIADAITVTTEPLAEFYSTWNRNVHVVPNRLPNYFASWLPELALMSPTEGNRRIVWAGSPTHGQDFHNAKELRYGLRRAIDWGNADLTFMGADYRRKMGGGNFIPWSGDIPSYHRSLLGAYDIGLCPLARTKFNDGKSGLKAMEYQAAGIVPIATDCPSYRGIIEHGRNGFLCRTQQDWHEAFQALQDDEVLRGMRTECLALTRDRTYAANISDWTDVYDGLLR